jgi:hypothetical protein
VAFFWKSTAIVPEIRDASARKAFNYDLRNEAMLPSAREGPD